MRKKIEIRPFLYAVSNPGYRKGNGQPPIRNPISPSRSTYEIAPTEGSVGSLPVFSTSDLQKLWAKIVTDHQSTAEVLRSDANKTVFTVPVSDGTIANLNRLEGMIWKRIVVKRLRIVG